MLNSCQVKKHAAEDDTAGKDLKLKAKKMLHIIYGYKHSKTMNPPTGRKCTNFRTVNCLWRRKNRLENTRETFYFFKKNQIWQNSMGRVQGFILITIFCIFEISCNLKEFNNNNQITIIHTIKTCHVLTFKPQKCIYMRKIRIKNKF